jgi:hypothetical protein
LSGLVVGTTAGLTTELVVDVVLISPGTYAIGIVVPVACGVGVGVMGIVEVVGAVLMAVVSRFA